jgi:DNA-binding winged helix-turn-helix (wHTH) protein
MTIAVMPAAMRLLPSMAASRSGAQMSSSTATADPVGYEVDDLYVDLGRQRVSRGGHELPLSALSFDLLLALVRAAPNLLTYDRLMQQVWPGLVVGTETVSQRVKLVREALGDDAHAPRYIVGVRGRGYRMLARVAPVLHRPTAGAAVVAEPPAPAAPDQGGTAVRRRLGESGSRRDTRRGLAGSRGSSARRRTRAVLPPGRRCTRASRAIRLPTRPPSSSCSSSARSAGGRTRSLRPVASQWPRCPKRVPRRTAIATRAR